METDWFKKEDNACQFWTLNRTPKKLKEGDRVYFVKNNKIESSMRVFKIKSSKDEEVIEKCLLTNREWKGRCILYMDDLKIEDLNLNIKGFQGFRYKWW